MRSKWQEILMLILFISFSILICFFIRSKMVERDFEEFFSNHVNEVLVNDPVLPFYQKGDYTEGLYQEEFLSVDQLYEEAELVVIAKPKSRRQDTMIVKTTMQVQTVIKHDANFKEETFTMFEQYAIIDQNRINIDTGCTLPMKLGTSYLLFLTKDTDYQTQDMYRSVSLYYGRYPVVDELRIYKDTFNIYTDQPKYSYSADILAYDIAYFDMSAYADQLKEEGGEQTVELEAINRYGHEYLETYLKCFDEVKEKGWLLYMDE